MNAKTFICILIVFSLFLAACGASVAPTQAQPEPVVVATQVVEKETSQEKPEATVPQPQPAEQQPAQPPARPMPLPTASPAGTQAPAAPLLSQPTPVDNTFVDYGVNSFTDTREDHLSTFAIDVDTAAYSVARRYVMDGNLPPYEAVRVEEFVNYFDAGYPTPPNVAFGLYADGAPSPWDNTQILRFGIQGYQVAEAERKPAVLTFVIDVSGSMEMENRLGLVKQSLNLLVDRLRWSDSVAIVVYGSQAEVVLYPTSGDQRQVIQNAIAGLHSTGATNAEAGLRLGYQVAMQSFQPGAINRVILCSDGVANVGATGPNEILAKIRGYAEEGVTLTSIGVGMGNFNDVLMEQLADNGNGTYAYIDDLDEARRLFVDELTSTLQVIALDAKVQVDFNPDVVARYRLIGYENRDVADEDFRNDAVDAGEIGAGHSVTALYSVQLYPNANGRIATLQLRWQDPDNYAVQEINGNFNTWDLAPTFESTAPRYQLAVVAAQYAEVLRLSPYAAHTSIRQVLDHAVRLAGLIPEDRDVTEFVSLVSRASQINALAGR